MSLLDIFADRDPDDLNYTQSSKGQCSEGRGPGRLRPQFEEYSRCCARLTQIAPTRTRKTIERFSTNLRLPVS